MWSALIRWDRETRRAALLRGASSRFAGLVQLLREGSVFEPRRDYSWRGIPDGDGVRRAVLFISTRLRLLPRNILSATNATLTHDPASLASRFHNRAESPALIQPNPFHCAGLTREHATMQFRLPQAANVFFWWFLRVWFGRNSWLEALGVGGGEA